jgi:hypothetical protein
MKEKVTKIYKRKDYFVMQEIIALLPVLLIAILMNIAAGTYFNIEKGNINFSWKKFISGIIKGIIIGGMFIGTAYCFDATDLSSIGIKPIFIMLSAISLYVGKAIISLGKILGVSIKK